MVEGGDPDSSPTGVVTRQRGGPRQREGVALHWPAPPRRTRHDRYAAEQGARASRQEREGTRLERRSPRWRSTRGPGPPVGGWGVPVAESVLAPPGPIPNPVVTQRSAGEYCGGDPTGGEAAADTPHPRTRSRSDGQTARRPDGQSPIARWPAGLQTRRGVEQR